MEINILEPEEDIEGEMIPPTLYVLGFQMEKSLNCIEDYIEVLNDKG